MCCVLDRLVLASFFVCLLLCLSGGSRVALYSASRDQSTQHTRVSVAKCLSMAVFFCVGFLSLSFVFLNQTSADNKFALEPHLHVYPLLDALAHHLPLLHAEDSKTARLLRWQRCRGILRFTIHVPLRGDQHCHRFRDSGWVHALPPI